MYINLTRVYGVGLWAKCKCLLFNVNLFLRWGLYDLIIRDDLSLHWSMWGRSWTRRSDSSKHDGHRVLYTSEHYWSYIDTWFPERIDLRESATTWSFFYPYIVSWVYGAKLWAKRYGLLSEVVFIWTGLWRAQTQSEPVVDMRQKLSTEILIRKTVISKWSRTADDKLNSEQLTTCRSKLIYRRWTSFWEM